MADTELDRRHDYMAVGCTHRVYILFASDYIPVWSEILRLVLRLRQGTKVTHTHTLVAVQHTEDKLMSLYEMEYNDGMNEYILPYESVYYSDSILKVEQTQYNGAVRTITWNAIDVTRFIEDHQLIEERFYNAFTPVPLTPWTLLTHLLDEDDKLTWTCTGLVQVLMGFDKDQSFNHPLTPDQLHATINLMLQNS